MGEGNPSYPILKDRKVSNHTPKVVNPVVAVEYLPNLLSTACVGFGHEQGGQRIFGRVKGTVRALHKKHYQYLQLRAGIFLGYMQSKTCSLTMVLDEST